MNNEELLEVQRRLQRQHGITPPAPAAPDPAAVAEGMMNMVAGKAEKSRHQETEYLAADGLLRCKVCGGPRQTIITPPFEGAKPRTVRCWCKCPTDYDLLRKQEGVDRIETARMVCFEKFEDFKGWTFDRADDRQPEMLQAARGYAEHFAEYLKDGKGLLFYGDVGTGKTLHAACVANNLIDRGYKVKLTSLGIEADKIWAAEDKAAYINSLCNYDLLILDDLGAERKTEYMQEMVYKIINARVAQCRPMIITTNLTREELGRPADIVNKRIYSRVLQRCLAVHVEGEDNRMLDGAANKIEMRKQLGIGGAGS